MLLVPIGYLPKSTSMGGRICHQSQSSTTSIGQGDIPIFVDIIFGWMKLWTTSVDTTTHAGYGDIPVITPINVSVNNIRCVQHLQVTLLYYNAFKHNRIKLTKGLKKKPDDNNTWILCIVLTKSWKQHTTKHQLYCHLPYLPTPSLGQDMTQGQFLSGV